MGSLRLAVEGCGHGTLHAIYASVERSCAEKGWPDVDLLIICGDFQAVRNAYDLNCVAMPAKYREMCDFHEYYSGLRKAPYPTIFVGGNHEASNYLFELYYGGWVAENIYYMGAANVLQFGPIRIAGMSGIWKGYNYNKPHHERLPYNADDLKSIYHVRDIDARKLLQTTGTVDVGISHDWPRGVEWLGDWKALFRRKEHLEPDARSGQLGNVAAKNVLDALRPGWWFSGHLHCKYAAVIDHTSGNQHSTLASSENPPQDDGHVQSANDSNAHTAQPPLNADEIDLDLDDAMEPAPMVHNPDAIDLDEDDDNLDDQKSHPFSETTEQSHQASFVVGQNNINQTFEQGKHHQNGMATSTDSSPTRFLALDKCLAGRHFLQLLEIPASTEAQRPFKFSYDREWLAITRAFALKEPLILGDCKFNAPRAKSREQYREFVEEQLKWVDSLTEEQLIVPTTFTTTAPVYDGGNIHDPRYSQAAGGLQEYSNPQTSQFCDLLQIPNPFDLPTEAREERMRIGPRPSQERFQNGGHSSRGGRGGKSFRGSKRGGWKGANTKH